MQQMTNYLSGPQIHGGGSLYTAPPQSSSERERDEAEEDEEENSRDDHSLGLWAVAQQQGVWRGSFNVLKDKCIHILLV